jgi:hypothetical protein
MDMGLLVEEQRIEGEGNILLRLCKPHVNPEQMIEE